MNVHRGGEGHDHVVVIGGGFSGALQAVNLLRHHGPRTTLVERRPHVARGVAYSAAHPDHLLNVRASNMSALPDDPGHFQRWLSARSGAAGNSFASRISYGDYLAALLDETASAMPGRLDVVQDEAVALRPASGRKAVILRSGRDLIADTVILAPGNLPPHDPLGARGPALSADHYEPDPWSGDIAGGLDDDDLVILFGTGLTMVDAALLLEARGFRGKILAVSRRGLLPHVHAEVHLPQSSILERPAARGAHLIRDIRMRASEIGWRAAVDELRPHTQAMWLSASQEDRARFLRHLRPWWDIHRHRLAPQVASRIAAMRDRGQLEIAAGKLTTAQEDGSLVQVSWRIRGGDAVRHAKARRIVNCTGPQGDLLRSDEPLLRQLLADGLIRPDGHRLGIDVTAQSETISRDGAVNPGLFAIGPMTRGTFWEIVAVPDIRIQTWNVARRLANAHWVEGEGL